MEYCSQHYNSHFVYEIACSLALNYSCDMGTTLSRIRNVGYYTNYSNEYVITRIMGRGFGLELLLLQPFQLV